MTAREFFFGLAQGVSVVAAIMAQDAPEVEECRNALARAEAAVGSSTTGYGCAVVPVFFSTAKKV